MTLAELLESRFRGDVRFRGAAYLQAERVSVTRVTGDHLFAVVRDGVEYQTQISRQDNVLKLACNCGQAAAPNNNGNIQCKHVWATVLAADAGGRPAESRLGQGRQVQGRGVSLRRNRAKALWHAQAALGAA